MLLDGCHAANALVVGYRFIISCDEAHYILVAPLFQYIEPKVAVQKAILIIVPLYPYHDGWLNDAYFADRRGNLTIFEGFPDRILHLSNCDYIRKRNSEARCLESKFDFAMSIAAAHYIAILVF